MTLIRTLILLLLPLAAFAQDFSPLPVRDAFKLKFTQSDTQIKAQWDIAKGYYLYRDRINITSNSSTIQIQGIQKPDGKIKDDPVFGKVATYRDHIAVSAEITGSGTAQIHVRYQGCADAGLCYPPETETFSVALANQNTAGPAWLNSPQDNTAQSDLLAEDVAFQLSAEFIDDKHISVRWNIAEGYYLYKESIKLSLGSSQTISNIQFSESTRQEDEYYGDTEVFYGSAQAMIQLQQPATRNLNLLAEYQGCASIGVCYPVIKKDYPLVFSNAMPTSGISAQNPINTNEDRFAQILDEGNVWAIIAVFFVGGLLLSFTACVYPMIPILSGIIAGEGEQISTKRAFLLSLTYVESAAIAYALIGIAIAATGEPGSIQTKFQNPWLVSAMSALFVVLALSMFEVFHLRLPHWFTTKVHEISHKQRGGTFVGVAIMGMLSVFIISACSGPALVAALTYIQNTGNTALGAIALFVMGNGIGLPLLIMGTTEGKLMPKAGTWMHAIKAFFGIAFLGVAIYLLEKILPGSITLALWALLLIGCAVFMGATEHLHGGSTAIEKLKKSFGIAAMVYGIILLIGATLGSTNLWQPLQQLNGQTTTAPMSTTPLKMPSVTSVKQLRTALANNQERPILVDAYADWCTYCVKYDQKIFKDPEVAGLLQQFTLIKADVTDQNDQTKALMKHLGVFLPPVLIFYNAQGQELTHLRVVGEMDARELSEHLRNVLSQQ